MKSASAIMKFMNTPGNRPETVYPRVKVSEIKEFKESCSSEEWEALGKDACAVLGEEYSV